MPLSFDSSNFGAAYGKFTPVRPEEEVNRPGLPQEVQEQLTARIFNRQTSSNVGVSAPEMVARWAAGTAIDLADTLAGSAIVPFTERGDVWSLFDDTEQREFYERNKGLVEGSSALVGAFGTAIVGSALVLPRVANALASSTAISTSRIWQAGVRMNESTRMAMLEAQQAAAKAGTPYRLMRNSAGRKYLGLEVGKGAAYGLAEEGLIYAAMNANEALYTGDVSTDLFWSALGPVIGGAIGGISARAYSREIGNSQLIRDIRAGTTDPAGISNDLVAPVDTTQYKTADVKLKDSARFTEYMANSRVKTPTGAAEEIVSKMYDIRSQMDSLADETLQSISNKGIDFVPVKRGQIAKSAEWKAFKEAAKDDPFLAHGLDQMGVVNGKLDDAFKARSNAINELRAQKEFKQAKILEDQEPFLFFNGRFNAADNPITKTIADFDPSTLKIADMKVGAGVKMKLDSGEMIINEAFHLGNANRSFASLSTKDQLSALEGVNRVLSRMKRQKIGLIVHDNMNWFQLDAIAEYARRGGKVEFGTSGFNNIEELQLHSLQMKADELLANKGNMKPIDEYTRLAYNLPGGSTFERMEDAAGDLIRGWLKMSQAYRNSNMSAATAIQELGDALQKGRALKGFDLAPSKQNPHSDIGRIDGNVFHWNRSPEGKWLKPMLAYFDTRSSIQPLTKEGIAETLALRKAVVIRELLDPAHGAGHVPVLTRALLEMPETQKAMNILGLSDDQITGLGSNVSQALGEALPRRFRYRDNETLLAASRVQEITHRLSNARIEELMRTSGLDRTLEELGSAGREQSKALLNQWFSNRGGFDLETDTVTMGKYHGFALSDTPKNQRLLGVTEVPEGTLLENPRTGKAIVVDDLGLKTLQQFELVTGSLRGDRNRLRLANGQKPIGKMNWYAPPPNLKGKRVAFVLDEFDNVVPGWTLVADTDEGFKQLAERTKKDLIDEFGQNNGYKIRDKAALEHRRDIWDDAAIDWVDPGFAGARPGSQEGRLTGRFVNPRAFEDTLEWVKRQVIQEGHDVLRTVFNEQIQVARAHAAAEKHAMGLDQTRYAKTRTIWDEYEATLFGKQQAYSESSISGSVLSSAETQLNRVLQDRPQMSARWVIDLAERMGAPVGKLAQAKSYDHILSILGPHTPFKNAMDYAEANLQIQRPPDVRRISQGLARLSSAVMLRAFELSHASLNLFSLMATMPALIRAGRAPITAGFKLQSGAKVGVADGMRIATDAMKDMFSKRQAVNADWNHMVKMGDATQEVADFHRQMASVDSPSAWRRVFLGSNNPKDSFVKRKGIDGLISVATDKSEEWSRQYAHFVGLRLADMHGIQGMGARHDFAREIANAAIADYAPVNRPELFQTGIGSLYGLFLSYVLNQNTKMFRWIEKKQFTELGINLGMQASLFGALGVPGVKQVMGVRDWFAESGATEPTALDQLYAQFGPQLGSILAHGGINVFGMAFYTRGDMSIRMPTAQTFNPLENPGIKTLMGVTKVINNTIQAALDDYPDNVGEQLVQTLTREMPNRVIKGWMTVLQGGDEIDHYGNIASQTLTWMDTTARLIGLRSTRQQAELNQYYSSKAAGDKDAARRDKLRYNVRNAARRFKETGEPFDWTGYYESYVKTGGNPRTFRNWIREQLRDADSPRAVKKLYSDLKNPSQQLRAWRYNAYGANLTD